MIRETKFQKNYHKVVLAETKKYPHFTITDFFAKFQVFSCRALIYRQGFLIPKKISYPFTKKISVNKIITLPSTNQ